MSDVVLIPLAEIRDHGRLRLPREARVAAIQASIAKIGLLQPLEVSPAKGGYDLTDGGVRLRALRALGHETAPCIVAKANADERRRREIDSNLMKSGSLTRMERALYLAARKPLYEAEHPETKNGGDRRSNQFAGSANWSGHQVPAGGTWSNDRVERFTSWAAKAFGLSERTVYDDLKVGCTLDAQACGVLADHDIADKLGELQKLARQHEYVQRRVAELMTSTLHPAETVQAALDIIGERVAQNDNEDRLYTRALGNFERMSTRERALFLQELAGRALPGGWRVVRVAGAQDVA